MYTNICASTFAFLRHLGSKYLLWNVKHTSGELQTLELAAVPGCSEC
jgi:hypothetical protein